MKHWIYKWLPIFCGCHCRTDRSFHYKGIPFPVCARCTGELIGMALALITCVFYRPPLWSVFVLMFPMAADGLAQRLTAYESTNLRRVLTGTLFGYALVMFFVVTFIAVFRYGMQLGKHWISN